ncbi:DUF3955 domain-containing protein [Castellaniella sp. WN]
MRFRIIAAFCVFVGVVCLGLFALLGSSVAPDGHLQEPFALLPLGWTFILFGGLGLVISLVRCALHKPKTRPTP